jgi:hypothetical protein
LFPWLPCWRHRPWCGVKDTFFSVLQRVQLSDLVRTNIVTEYTRWFHIRL